MAKLDPKRRAVLVGIAIVGVFLMLTGKPQKVQAPEIKEESLVSVVELVPVQANLVQETLEEVAAELPKEEIVTPQASVSEPEAPATSTFEKFIVYQDKPSRNRYVMSGFMPSGLCITMNDAWIKDCKEGRSCIKAMYDAECSSHETGWAGVYWLFPANNWGDQRAGHDLTGAIKLSFWARGEQGGEVISAFKMGGVGKKLAYTDSDSAEMGPVVLTKEWKQYNIYLFGKDLSHIIGGFAWVAKSKKNHGMVTFYLDDIHYE